MDTEAIIHQLFDRFPDIRYAALYLNDDLIFKQKEATQNSSSGGTDRFEELLVNPTLLTLAEQRGNIDCGGLRHLIVGYGNFYQLVKAVPKGHISICLDKNADLNKLPNDIFIYLQTQHSELFN